MQARCFLVERCQPRCLARQTAARIHRGFDHLDRFERRLAETGGLLAGRRAFSDAVKIGLGLRDAVDRACLFRCVERVFDQSPANAHQFAQKRQIINLLRQFARREKPCAVRGQLREIFGSAKLFQCLIGLEMRTQGDRRSGRIAFDQRENALINTLVQRFEKMLGPDRGLQFLDHAIVDQNRAQKRGLRLEVGGEFAPAFCGVFDKGDWGGFGHRHLNAR